MASRRHINLDEGWTEVTTKIRTRLERGGSENPLIPCPTFDLAVYDIVYAMCTQRPSYAEQLYVKYHDLCKVYFTTLVLPAINEGEGEIYMLREVVRRWKIYKMTIIFISKCFDYVKRNCTVIPLREIGFGFFSSHDMIRVHVKNAMISLIDQEREGELIDNALLKDVVAIYAEIDIDFYTNYFEPAMLESTGAYYARKAASWILQDSCMEYMLKAEECLRREKERVAHYLCEDSEQKLLQRVQDELLLHYKTQLVENEHSGYRVMLREDNRDGLSKMCSLFCRIPEGLTSIVNGFRDHIISKETPLIAAIIDSSHGSQEDAGFVFTVINMLEKSKKDVKDTFGHSHFHFERALQEAFDLFCNKRFEGRKSAEFLAMLCHNLLKKGVGENLSNDYIEEVLDRVAKFVVRVTNRYQLFEEIYRDKLADRLLFNQSANENHEQSILSKLTQHFAVTFYSKMKAMIADSTQSRKLQSSFEASLIENPNIHPGINFTVRVLCRGLWPRPRFNAFSKLNLPSEMVKCVEVFTDFYSTETERRRLTWIYSLGSCNIIGTFDAGQIEMIGTTYQAVLLLLFNASEKLSYTDIKSQLNLRDEDLVSVLNSLALAKHKVLLKEPNTASVTPRDTFEVNLTLTHKRKKIRFPKPLQQQFKRVAKDRSSAIDASLVRIMKNLKVFPYKRLVSQCIQQFESMFKTEEEVIAKRIQGLIDREFFEFDKQDSKILRYLP